MRILSQQQSDALRSWLHQFSATHVPRSVQTFHGDLRRRMGRNPYFERRRGARLIPISEQKFILKVLKIVGVTEEMQFDSYEQAINWYD